MSGAAPLDDDSVWASDAAKGVLIALAHAEGQTTVRVTAALVSALEMVISMLAEIYPDKAEAASLRIANLILQAGKSRGLATIKVAGNA